MDLQSEERETGIRRIQKCVGFNVPTKDDGLMEATAPRLPPDPTCLPSSSRRPTARADITGTYRAEGKEPAIKVGRENKGIKPENVSEVIEARTMRRRGNGVYECVKDVMWADICSPRVSLRGHSV